jgi:PTH1 family peptidyl-tRNA hydrolase
MRDPLGLKKRRAAASAAANGESLGSTAWLVVGLGNPGGTYRGTRHNVGFELIDRLGEQVGIAVDKKEKKFKALVGSGDVDGRRVVLIKPTTYMNLSGDSVMLVAGHYKVWHAHSTHKCP